VYTGRFHGRVRAVYTAVYGPYTRSCTPAVYIHGRVHGPCTCTAVYTCVHGRVHGLYTAVKTARARPRTRSVVYTCTRSVHGDGHGPCTRPCKGRVHGRVHRPYTRRCIGRVHGPYTAVNTYIIRSFLTKCCDYIRKQSKAPYCLSPEVYYFWSKTGSGIKILYLGLLAGPITLQWSLYMFHRCSSSDNRE